MCRVCYEVYRRLDSLRDEADRTGTRKSSRFDILANIDATAASGRRAAAAEVGAATLSAEVEAMLKDVDAGAGNKLGIEAGIIWRRRLRCVNKTPRSEMYVNEIKKSRGILPSSRFLALVLFLARRAQCVLGVTFLNRLPPSYVRLGPQQEQEQRRYRVRHGEEPEPPHRKAGATKAVRPRGCGGSGPVFRSGPQEAGEKSG